MNLWRGHKEGKLSCWDSDGSLLPIGYTTMKCFFIKFGWKQDTVAGRRGGKYSREHGKESYVWRFWKGILVR